MALSIPEGEYEIKTVRSSGPGGQHANKTETAVQLRFDIRDSSLAEEIKQRLLKKRDNRITSDGVVIILAQRSRSQLKNRQDAVRRLHALVKSAARPKKKRKKTTPTKASREKRLRKKKQRSEVKKRRKKIDPDDL